MFSVLFSEKRGLFGTILALLRYDGFFPHPWWTLKGDRVGLKHLADLPSFVGYVKVVASHQNWSLYVQ